MRFEITYKDAKKYAVKNAAYNTFVAYFSTL